ncbi:MAG: NAD(P)H-hydrate dehydratase [Burkholderiaceae bacterium]
MNPTLRSQPLNVDDVLLAKWPLPVPPEGSDKEVKGHVLLVGGSLQMPGAIILAATAALRAGAGKLTVATARTVAPLVAAQVPEAKVISLAEDPQGVLSPNALMNSIQPLADKFDAVVIGPGFEVTSTLLDDIIAILPSFAHAKIILDACAMDAVMLPSWHAYGDCRWPNVLLTPHAGEMAHLSGRPKDEVLSDSHMLLERLTRQWNAVVALKGARTLVANPQGESWHHEGGNSGLGVSGSGDTLAGIIGGLAARGASLEQACVWGVALHARAGEALARKLGPTGYLAREISAEVPRLMHEMTRVHAAPPR